MKRFMASAAFATALVLCCSMCYAEDMVQVKGSDTLINVVQKLAEEYMAKKPGTAIAVTGGGSGTGIAALVNKKCDIANSSRGIKAQEVADANVKGVDPKRIVVAIDALSIIVNANNPVNQLTVEQIGKIYRGETSNWKDVGGNDSPITLYGRQSNSGTYDFMKENVMRGEYSSKLKSMNGNAQIVEAIKQDASGIGYVGVGYAKDLAGINIVSVALTPVIGYFSPVDPINVKNGKYPITRPLNQYTNGIPVKTARDFILYELSAAGQAIVEKEGFYAIPDEYQRYNDNVLGRSYELGSRQKSMPVQGEYSK